MHRNRTQDAASLDDAYLFTRFMAGEDAAFAMFLKRHSRKVHAYCLRMVGDADTAHDIMQEAWERMVRMRKTRAEVPNPTQLLITIVRNLSLNHMRDRREHLPLDLLPDSQHPGMRPHEPSYLEELVVMALDRLPFPQREVIILHVYSGYDYTEIARIMELPVDAVRMRAMRGRAHLARIIGAMMAVEDERIRGMEGRV